MIYYWHPFWFLKYPRCGTWRWIWIWVIFSLLALWTLTMQSFRLLRVDAQFLLSFAPIYWSISCGVIFRWCIRKKISDGRDTWDQDSLKIYLRAMWKVSTYVVFSRSYFLLFGLNSVRMCPYSVWTRENKDQKKLGIWTLFTQWRFLMKNVII